MTTASSVPRARARLNTDDVPRRASPGTASVGTRARVDPSAFVGASSPKTPAPAIRHTKTAPIVPTTRNASTPPALASSRAPWTPPVASTSSSTPSSAVTANGARLRGKSVGIDSASSSPQAVFQPRATVTAGLPRRAESPNHSPTVRPRTEPAFATPPFRPRSPIRPATAVISPDLGRRSPTRLGGQSPDPLARSHAGPSGPDRPQSRLAKSTLGMTTKPIIARARPFDAQAQLDHPGVLAEAFVRPTAHTSAPAQFADQLNNRAIFAASTGVPGLGFETSSGSSSAITPPAVDPTPMSPSRMPHRRSNSMSSHVSSVNGAKPPSAGRIEEDEMDPREREIRLKLEEEMAEREREQEARVHRKILDLEISNASLLAINASLERAKHKQTTELRDLRRRQRDRSLAIPLASPGTGEFGGGLLSPKSEGAEFDLEQDIETEQDWEAILREDPMFADIAGKLESLVARAHEAVESKASSERRVLAFVNADEEDQSTSLEQSFTSPTLALGGRLRRSPGASMLSAETSFSPAPLTPEFDRSDLLDSPIKD